jgi:hypothetical protein
MALTVLAQSAWPVTAIFAGRRWHAMCELTPNALVRHRLGRRKRHADGDHGMKQNTPPQYPLVFTAWRDGPLAAVAQISVMLLMLLISSLTLRIDLNTSLSTALHDWNILFMAAGGIALGAYQCYQWSQGAEHLTIYLDRITISKGNNVRSYPFNHIFNHAVSEKIMRSWHGGKERGISLQINPGVYFSLYEAEFFPGDFSLSPQYVNDEITAGIARNRTSANTF